MTVNGSVTLGGVTRSGVECIYTKIYKFSRLKVESCVHQ